MGKKVTVNKKSKKDKSKPANQNDPRIQILQMALSEAIDQNQTLRKRVCELQALLVAAQMRFEEMTQRQERKDTRDSDHLPQVKVKRSKYAKS